MAANAQMDQYIDDARVREVMDRYFLDKDETTPENTGKNYGPKQAEWRVRILPLPPEYRGAVADEGIQKWCAKTWPPIPVDWALQMRTWPTGRQLPGDLVDEGKLLLLWHRRSSIVPPEAASASPLKSVAVPPSETLVVTTTMPSPAPNGAVEHKVRRAVPPCPAPDPQRQTDWR